MIFVKVELYDKEAMKFMKDNQITLWKPMLPALVQGFFFISFFWALYPMAELPVESLKNGGILWFKDLSAADPYYIMPAFSGGTMAYLLIVSFSYLLLT